MEFNTTTGIWSKIKEYIDSKLSSTGGGIAYNYPSVYKYGIL